MGFSEVDKLAINTISTLAVDATFNTNSGHPGAPMGMAPAAHVLLNTVTESMTLANSHPWSILLFALPQFLPHSFASRERSPVLPHPWR